MTFAGTINKLNQGHRNYEKRRWMHHDKLMKHDRQLAEYASEPFSNIEEFRCAG